jgi:hypothetical protein
MARSNRRDAFLFFSNIESKLSMLLACNGLANFFTAKAHQNMPIIACRQKTKTNITH